MHARVWAPGRPAFTLRATGALLALVALAALAHAPLALTYVDSSPVGASFPEWEGGDTELAFADLNGDGHADVVTIGDHSSPYIGTGLHGVIAYLGDGAGGWTLRMTGNFGYGGIAVGDANGDGFMDVGYGMHHDYSSTDLGDQLIEVALGDGTAASWTPWDDGLATNGESWGMFATDFADFDLDGRLDLASNSFGCCNGVHVYLNGGDGSWAQSWASAGGNSRSLLVAGDVNGDGAPDIAASQQSGTIWLGDGAGGFTAANAGLPPAGNIGLRGIALGDVDGDGCADLACVQSGGPRVYLWRGDHWESASTGLPASGSYSHTQLWDFDLDGFVDLAALANGTGTLWRGDGAGGWSAGGGFAAPIAVDTQAFTTGGDVDHNGHPDFAFVQEQGSWPNYQNHFYVYRESSTPTARRVVWQYPRGSETWVVGSAQTLRWSAAWLGPAPASVALELSTSGPGGPWQPLAASLADGGHWQWTVSGEATSRAHLRATLTQDGESVSAVSRAFRILPGGATAAPAAPPAGLALRVLENPALGQARFAITGLPTGAQARLAIFGVDGRRLISLPAASAVRWDLRDAAGRRVPAGVYLARVEGAGQAAARASVLVLR
ncbi:hypothetical protein FJ251_11665 [bacterium]|nr:hypothetical protein [bacterium]